MAQVIKTKKQKKMAQLNFGGTVETTEAREDLVSYINTELHNVSADVEMNQDLSLIHI